MAEETKAQVAVVMGSDSDWAVMQDCVELLSQMGVTCEAMISSAHRSPNETAEFARVARARGIEVIIAAAGMAAHLAGVVAAHTVIPVIGVPLASGALQGVDALLSTVQMPPGIPVATVGIGSAGAKNAALLAVQILALKDPKLADNLVEYKLQLPKSVKQKNAKLQEELKKSNA